MVGLNQMLGNHLPDVVVVVVGWFMSRETIIDEETLRMQLGSHLFMEGSMVTKERPNVIPCMDQFMGGWRR